MSQSPLPFGNGLNQLHSAPSQVGLCDMCLRQLTDQTTNPSVLSGNTGTRATSDATRSKMIASKVKKPSRSEAPKRPSIGARYLRPIVQALDFSQAGSRSPVEASGKHFRYCGGAYERQILCLVAQCRILEFGSSSATEKVATFASFLLTRLNACPVLSHSCL